MELVVLGLGSNVPFRTAANVELSCVQVLLSACDYLKKKLKDFKASSLYRTKAMYVQDQQDFFNMVVCGRYQGDPQELLFEVQAIEALFGRNRRLEQRNGPRTLDIDIELFGSRCIQQPDGDFPLFIPHRLIAERQFVLIPLLEILPNSADPITGKKYADFLIGLEDQGCRKLNSVL